MTFGVELQPTRAAQANRENVAVRILSGVNSTIHYASKRLGLVFNCYFGPKKTNVMGAPSGASVRVRVLPFASSVPENGFCAGDPSGFLALMACPINVVGVRVTFSPFWEYVPLISTPSFKSNVLSFSNVRESAVPRSADGIIAPICFSESGLNFQVPRSEDPVRQPSSPKQTVQARKIETRGRVTAFSSDESQ